MSDGNGHATSAPAPPDAGVQASRLLTTLTTAGVLAGLLLVVVYGLTLPTIEANKARALQAAINEVLKAPERYDTLYVVGNSLTTQLPPGADARRLERVYLGYGPNDQPIGFAIPAHDAGFQDVVGLIFGYDPRTRTLLGMKVLESKETPGLGDKIEKDQAFVAQFDGARAPLVGVKSRGGARATPAEIHMITGATISSRAVIRIINNALERLGPLVEAYPTGGKG